MWRREKGGGGEGGRDQEKLGKKEEDEVGEGDMVEEQVEMEWVGGGGQGGGRGGDGGRGGGAGG